MLKAWHLISMVTWFAGLFYLPRLFVYHAMSEDHISLERFKVMERKLLFGITTPGAVFTLLFGIWMLVDYAWAAFAGQLWFSLKLGLIGLLLLYHVYCGVLWLDFRLDRNRRSHIWFRWFNEVPVLLLVAITLLAVLRPL